MGSSLRSRNTVCHLTAVNVPALAGRSKAWARSTGSIADVGAVDSERRGDKIHPAWARGSPPLTLDKSRLLDKSRTLEKAQDVGHQIHEWACKFGMQIATAVRKSGPVVCPCLVVLAASGFRRLGAGVANTQTGVTSTQADGPDQARHAGPNRRNPRVEDRAARAASLTKSEGPWRPLSATIVYLLPDEDAHLNLLLVSQHLERSTRPRAKINLRPANGLPFACGRIFPFKRGPQAHMGRDWFVGCASLRWRAHRRFWGTGAPVSPPPPLVWACPPILDDSRHRFSSCRGTLVGFTQRESGRHADSARLRTAISCQGRRCRARHVRAATILWHGDCARKVLTGGSGRDWEAQRVDESAASVGIPAPGAFGLGPQHMRNAGRSCQHSFST